LNPPDISRPTATDHVREDYRVAEMLRAGRAADLSGDELRRIGARVLATLDGERGLARTFVPMESERSASTISRIAERDRLIVMFAVAHFRRERTERAADGVRRRLIRYCNSAKRGPHPPGSEDEFCRLILEASPAVLGVEAIRKVLAREEF
jgi:hypothetical protein